ncbi:unnamed protein product [Caenorhabditis auriculariae]|uniref:SCP2 domain-containing protein n=1 Tax=Caenorhabditis auriculariae TaxID=2777116 RepID=A0A8S1HM43_9PELO|nr:unnamed protein product [Caenorhabditis auriculariae]
MNLMSDAVFQVIKEEIGKHEAVKKMKGVVEFRINVEGQERSIKTIDFHRFPATVSQGKSSMKPSATMEDEDFVRLCMGDLDPIQGFMSGKLKVKGDILLMQKLSSVLKGARKSLL